MGHGSQRWKGPPRGCANRADERAQDRARRRGGLVSRPKMPFRFGIVGCWGAMEQKSSTRRGSRPIQAAFKPLGFWQNGHLCCGVVADMGVANRGADVLVAEQLLDFPQILSHVVKKDCGRAVPQPVRGDLPHPEAFASGPKPQIESPVRERSSPNIPQTQIATSAVACVESSIIPMLLDAGAWLDPQDEEGRTPLHWAVRLRSQDAVRRLLGAGASIEIRDRDGQTPLDLARASGNQSLVELLERHSVSRTG